MCSRKNQVFSWFTINSQPNLKKFSTLFLNYLPRETANFLAVDIVRDRSKTLKKKIKKKI